MEKISKIQKLDTRKIWQKEPQFSAWLSKNIDYLNDVIGLDITIQSTEENVGPYKVDIYGEDVTGAKVIIENQLEKTDHTHLGQVLTYMVNLDAGITIWIAKKAVEEHRKVVEWLNETTPDDMSFYLVTIESITLDGGKTVAPLFTLIEGPTKESKKIGGAKKEFARSHTVRMEFWTQFIEESNKANTILKNNKPGIDAWIGSALGFSGVSMNFVVSKNYARTEIYINRGDQDENKVIFDKLYSRKNQIETAFGGPLVWERMEDRITSRVKNQLDGVNVYEESDWAKMNNFLIDSAERMQRVFKIEVQKLKK